jgi:hypothetical protein
MSHRKKLWSTRLIAEARSGLSLHLLISLHYVPLAELSWIDMFGAKYVLGGSPMSD